MVTDILEEPAACIFWIKEDPEDRGSKFLCNIVTHLWNYMESHPWRLQF
jgi:hypothetical protein